MDRYLHVLYRPRSYSFGLARRVLHEIIEPTFDDELAVRLTSDRLETLLTPLYRDRGPATTRLTLQMLHQAFAWAQRHGWCQQDPTEGFTLRRLR